MNTIKKTKTKTEKSTNGGLLKQIWYSRTNAFLNLRQDYSILIEGSSTGYSPAKFRMRLSYRNGSYATSEATTIEEVHAQIEEWNKEKNELWKSCVKQQFQILKFKA